MSFKCKIGLHSWDGCKCSECDKNRDEQHDWSKDCNVCNKCGISKNRKHDWHDNKCLKCGRLKDAEIANERALKKCQLGDYKGALQDFNEVIKIDPNYPFALGDRGLTKYYLKDYDGAIKDLDDVIKIYPHQGNLYNNRGISRQKLEDYFGAMVDYIKAIELDPYNKYASENLITLKAKLVKDKLYYLISNKLKCQKCSKVYLIGQDAAAVSFESVTDLFGSAVFINHESGSIREDLLKSFDHLLVDDQSKRAMDAWQIIWKSLEQGQKRVWKCHDCQKVNSYDTLQPVLDVIKKDEDGRTKLHIAAIDGDKTEAKRLIDLGADVNVKDNNGDTPLHLAEYWGVLSKRDHYHVSVLLKSNDANQNAKNNNGLTPNDLINERIELLALRQLKKDGHI